jgi:hypothetical protein
LSTITPPVRNVTLHAYGSFSKAVDEQPNLRAGSRRLHEQAWCLCCHQLIIDTATILWDARSLQLDLSTDAAVALAGLWPWLLACAELCWSGPACWLPHTSWLAAAAPS